MQPLLVRLTAFTPQWPWTAYMEQAFDKRLACIMGELTSPEYLTDPGVSIASQSMASAAQCLAAQSTARAMQQAVARGCILHRARPGHTWSACCAMHPHRSIDQNPKNDTKLLWLTYYLYASASASTLRNMLVHPGKSMDKDTQAKVGTRLCRAH